MSLIASIKVLGDLCFYFSIISVLPILFSGKILWLWPGLLCAVGAALAVEIHQWTMTHRKSTKWRYTAAVLPLSILAMAGTAVDLVILVPAALYTVLVIHKGIYTLEYFPYRNQFQYSMILWGIVFVLCFLVENLSRPFDGQIRFHYESMLAYGMAYCVCAVFLLRHLRLGLHGDWKRSALNGGELAGVGVFAGIISVVVFGGWALYRYFRGPINGFFTAILSVFMLVPVAVEQSISEGIQDLDWDALFQEVALEQEKNQEFFNPPVEQMSPLWSEIRKNPMVASMDSVPWWLVILIVAVLSFALWKMLSVYMKTAPGTVKAGVRGMTRIEAVAKPKDRRSPREKVRRCYRDFLKLMEHKGFERKLYHTSEDILAATDRMVSPQAAAALRQVYIAARYNEDAIVTEEQVRAARKALKELKEYK